MNKILVCLSLLFLLVFFTGCSTTSDTASETDNVVKPVNSVKG